MSVARARSPSLKTEVIPEKHVEAKDKLRVDKRTVSDEEQFSEELRKERIDVERDDEHRAA